MSNEQGSQHSQYTTLEAAAAELQVAYETLRKAVIEHEVPHLKIGRLVRLRMSDLFNALDASRLKPSQAVATWLQPTR